MKSSFIGTIVGSRIEETASSALAFLMDNYPPFQNIVMKYFNEPETNDSNIEESTSRTGFSESSEYDGKILKINKEYHVEDSCGTPGRIDLLIENEKKQVFVIENKFGAAIDVCQLNRYSDSSILKDFLNVQYILLIPKERHYNDDVTKALKEASTWKRKHWD